MYKNKLDIRNNLVGINLKRFRFSHTPNLSQNDVAHRLQTVGYQVEKNSISDLENGYSVGQDFLVLALTSAYGLTLEDLFDVRKAIDFVKQRPDLFKIGENAMYSAEELPQYLAEKYNKPDNK